jgi:ribosomal protein S18 acetylase RimI-like enzyme
MDRDAAIEFRPAGPEDEGFLRGLYADTRREELAATGWAAETVAAFLAQQAEAQSKHYALHYAGADHRLVLLGGRPIGRILLYRMEREIRVVDLALLEEFRGRGIGTRLLREVLDEGGGTGRAVTIHVEKFNPALRLYARLGFAPVEDKGVNWFMRREAPSGGAVS